MNRQWDEPARLFFVLFLIPESYPLTAPQAPKGGIRREPRSVCS
ncbi:hypothetical protein ACFVYG_08765 [Streptomyces sp. NPDC058256]